MKEKSSSHFITVSPNRNNKNSSIEPLPSIDKKKTQKGEGRQRYYHKSMKPLSIDDTKQRSMVEERQLTNKNGSKMQIQVSLAGTKQSVQIYRKAKNKRKQSIKEKLIERSEVEGISKQMDQVKTSDISRQKAALSSIMHCIEKEFGNHWRVVAENKYSNRAVMYQPYRKKSLTQKQKLKPFVSETNLQSNEGYFFNVEKMALNDFDKPRGRANTIIINPLVEDKNYKRSNGPSTNNSMTSKDVSMIKEKVNINKLMAIHDEVQEDNLLKQSIKVAQCPMSRVEKHRSVSSAKQESHIQDGMATLQQKYLFNLEEKGLKEETKPPQPEFKVSFRKQLTEQIKRELLSQQIKKQCIQLKEEEQLLTNSVKKYNFSPTRKIRRRFIAPFETYHYRDLIWKTNYTNNRYVQIPLEYEHRLKVFVGKGNNSCMVSGLIARRPWFAFTDRIEDANFVWTQIKNLNYFKRQGQCKQQIDSKQLDKAKYEPESLLTDIDNKQLKSYYQNHQYAQEHNDERLLSRNKVFKLKEVVKTQEIKQTRMQNHLINNYVIGNKKALFNTMANYYQETNQHLFDFLPLTFHIKEGLEDKKYFEFLRYYHKRNKEINKSNQDKPNKMKEKNTWIVKPGQNSNRGHGIKMCLNLEQIKAIIKKVQKYNDGSFRTYIVQAYIQRPLLYHRRKIDIRHFMMITCVNGHIKGYWYKDGYVRTSSSEYSMGDNSSNIHLTNDAVQKQQSDYGKYQKGNKLSYDELNNYIEKYHKKKNRGFYDFIYPKMKSIATDSIRACSGGIDPNKLSNNFQIFGMDFMIDANLDVWLIQINSNPCLELSCPLLSSMIPRMIENALELTLDCMFPPPVRWSPKGMHYFKQLQKQNRFELVYDERVERLYTGSLQVLDNKLLEEEDDTFEDCGDEWQDD